MAANNSESNIIDDDDRIQNSIVRRISFYSINSRNSR